MSGDSDGCRFALSLDRAFQAAGWCRDGSGFSQSVYDGDRPPDGVIVTVHSAQVPSVDRFLMTLRETGISPSVQVDEKVPAGELRVIIGSKPKGLV